jgi:hypothetical protein
MNPWRWKGSGQNRRNKRSLLQRRHSKTPWTSTCSSTSRCLALPAGPYRAVAVEVTPSHSVQSFSLQLKTPRRLAGVLRIALDMCAGNLNAFLGAHRTLLFVCLRSSCPAVARYNCSCTLMTTCIHNNAGYLNELDWTETRGCICHLCMSPLAAALQTRGASQEVNMIASRN